MERASRHQCLIYDGAPSRHLASMAAVVSDKLAQNYRCLYLNSGPMVAGMQSSLTALGVDVIGEMSKTSLLLSSEQQHLVDGRFEIDAMIETLEGTLNQALADGYAGLWASGDMTWEMGPDRDFLKLLEYERRLEEFFREHDEITGICQYHADTMPPQALREGLAAHRSLYVNETLSLVNPYYVPAGTFPDADRGSGLDALLLRLCHAERLQ
jgi:hypothetical protein